MSTDYYEILGVSKNATDAEIKTAYRKQALKWHPDRNKSSDANIKFKEINKAYEILSNTKKRQIYDQYGASAFEKGNTGGGGQSTYQQGPFTYTYTTNMDDDGGPFENMNFGGFSDPFEIFESFFGFHSPFASSRSSQRKRRSLYETTISFDEAVMGVEKDVVVKGTRKSIKIPAGVDDGMKIRFSDFDLIIHVTQHKHFRREGQDIYFEKEISYSDAVLGNVVEVPTIRKTVKLRIQPGTKSGTTVRLRGEGVPYPNSSEKGDQYVVYTIRIPEKVSYNYRKLLEKLQEEE